jgi:mono/diheme cytochrome c family protein
MRFFGGMFVTIVIIIVIALIIIYSGLYNVSAARKPSGFENWLFGTTMDNSVERHSKSIKIPDLNSTEIIKEGFIHYNSMCVECHGAPGKEPTDMAKGLNPQPPDLSESAEDMSPEELFWVTKNGVRMTGMPAWGITNSDDKIWPIVAFIEKLPGMTGKTYDSLAANIGFKETGGLRYMSH